MRLSGILLTTLAGNVHKQNSGSVEPRGACDAACEFLKKEGMCESLETCEFKTTAQGKHKAGLIELTDFIGECYHPVIEGPGGWWVFDTPLAGQRGSEIEQKVSMLDTNWEDDVTVSFLFSDYAYGRRSMMEMDRLEASGEDYELGEAESMGMIVCRIFEKEVGCTMAYRFSFSGDNAASGQGTYEAVLSVEGDVLVVSDVTATADIREVDPNGEWKMDIFLAAGRYPLVDLMSRE